MRHARLLYAAFAVLAAVAGCGRSVVDMADRADWRAEAEAQCMQSGAVRESAGIVRIAPIEGPGACGAEYPLKVAAFGAHRAVGFAQELRPPGSVPRGGVAQPNWPPAAPRYAPPPQPYVPPQNALTAPPLSLEAPSASAPPIGRPQTVEPAIAPRYAPARGDDVPDDAVLPDRRRTPSQYGYAPPRDPRDERREPPRLGPSRGPAVTGALKTAVAPPATLACPMVSALDKWILEAVQPAAMRWFRQPVVEIKQISAYSCRGMVGNASPRISEHAFGNALDIAGFVLADGRTVTVKNGWNGAPEESAFLHDVQMAACERFTTVLGPGYNIYHYDHLHFDLIRRRSGRNACKPGAISGEVAYARQLQKSKYAQRGDRLTTGSIGPKATKQPHAVPGEDGFFDDDGDAGDVTGSIARSPSKSKYKYAVPGQDGFVDDE